MNASSVPRLDLAPKRKKPLSLWNPLDYLTLLYWAFFFPQAIRWYVETFGKPAYQKKAGRDVWQVLLHDSMQRRLVIQALFTLLIFTPGIAWVLQTFGVSIGWRTVTSSVVLGVVLDVTFGLVGGLVIGLAGGMGLGIASGVASGIVDGVVFGMVFSLAGGEGVILALGIVLGIAICVISGVKGGIVSDMMYGEAFSIAIGMVINVAIFVLIGVNAGVEVGTMRGHIVFGVVLGMMLGVVLGVTVGIVGGIITGRLIEWLLAGLLMRGREVPLLGTQTVWLPLPGYKRRIERWLGTDWEAGVHNTNELLAFTLQFIPVVGAVNAVSTRLSEDQLLLYLGVLIDNPYDWDLVRFGSASLKNAMWGRALESGLVLPIYIERLRRFLRERFPIALRLDTPARAACAGFWYWHEKEVEKAAEAFAVVKDIPHGAEIYGIAQAIVVGQHVETLQELGTLGQTVSLPFTQTNSLRYSAEHGELRPGTLRALRILADVAAEARTAHHAVAPLNRSAAIGRANAALTKLLETGAEFCPEPEWPLIAEIAKSWRDIVSKAGGVIGEEVLRQPVLNPYEGSSGLPVTGHTFVGRKAIISQIERHWANPGALPPLILYGHRRMGKSSILRNLDKGLPSSTFLVYLDMQNSATLISHTGDLLREFAECICQKCISVFPEAGLEMRPTDYADVGSARFALNALLARLDLYIGNRRLVLAVDEFETIQDKIDAGSIDPDVLKYLRSRIQEYHWLALIFAGLHQLDELGRDYKSVFYGQAEHIRVSYLSEADAIDLIARPHPDFALEYAPELRAELYRLTYGQPYLLQRLCWELVERWNERFLREGKSTPRELALDELSPVLTPDFYHAAGYYFDGLWYKNLTEDERAVLRVMAERETPWMWKELAAALPDTDLDAVFVLLKRHDVVLEDETGVRFASELLRRWVTQYADK